MYSRGIRINFDWSEYLDLAQELAGQTATPASKEAKLRSSISRAYYAAFCKARNHLRDVEGHSIPPTGEAHRYVIDTFRDSIDRRRRQVGINLDRLRINRNHVDYNDYVNGLSSMTVTALRIAQHIISVLGTL